MNPQSITPGVWYTNTKSHHIYIGTIDGRLCHLKTGNYVPSPMHPTERAWLFMRPASRGEVTRQIASMEIPENTPRDDFGPALGSFSLAEVILTDIPKFVDTFNQPHGDGPEAPKGTRVSPMGDAEVIPVASEAEIECRKNDTNGDGNCGRGICPICHPELQPGFVEYIPGQLVMVKEDAAYVAKGGGVFVIREIREREHWPYVVQKLFSDDCSFRAGADELTPFRVSNSTTGPVLNYLANQQPEIARRAGITEIVKP